MNRVAGPVRHRLAAWAVVGMAMLAPRATPAEQASAPAATPRAPVQGYRIEDWQALSSESLVLRTNDGRRYRATLMGKCIGLRQTDTIAFVTRGERTVERFAGIMLPDGTRCYFKSLEAVSEPADGGRDDAAAR